MQQFSRLPRDPEIIAAFGIAAEPEKHIVFQAAAGPGNYSGILGCPRTGKIGEYHVWKKEKAAFGNTAL
ncbi:hypothetical protein IMSAGC013_00323 [Lachnospiraceae bacterium]|jgi:hypothetical protein|nr:hypothetical protein IMSAGC013_00323 [Lachnospiraceae bacterium]